MTVRIVATLDDGLHKERSVTCEWYVCEGKEASKGEASMGCKLNRTHICVSAEGDRLSERRCTARFQRIRCKIDVAHRTADTSHHWKSVCKASKVHDELNAARC